MPQCDGVRRWSLWEMTSSWRWSPYKRPFRPLTPSLMWGHGKKIPPRTQESTLTRHWSCRGLLLGLSSFQNHEKQFSVDYKPPGLWEPVLAELLSKHHYSSYLTKRHCLRRGTKVGFERPTSWPVQLESWHIINSKGKVGGGNETRSDNDEVGNLGVQLLVSSLTDLWLMNLNFLVRKMGIIITCPSLACFRIKCPAPGDIFK